MTIYKIECHDPICGYFYAKQTFGSIDSAKRWLAKFVADLRSDGGKVEEIERKDSYEIIFNLGGFATYQYRVVSEFTID